MNDEVWKEIFVAVVSGLIVSLIMWLLRGTFNLISSHPWVIVMVGVLAGGAMALFRYRQPGSISAPAGEELYSDPENTSYGEDIAEISDEEEYEANDVWAV